MSLRTAPPLVGAVRIFTRVAVRTAPAFALLALAACAAHSPAETADSPAAAETTAAVVPAPPPAPKSMAQKLEEVYGKDAEKAAEAAAEEEAETERPRGTVVEAPQPPDGKWLVDDEGRQYFVRRIPKIEGSYRRIAEDQVRLRHGIPLILAGETEDEFLVKVFKVEEAQPADTGPTPEQVAEVEAAYRPEIAATRVLAARDHGTGLPRQAQWRNGFDLGDADGDGHLDIVHGPPRRGFSGPIILLGDGAGGWRHWEAAKFPKLPYDYGDAEAADFDGDGQLDMALAIHLSGLTVLRGDGAGGFEPWAQGLKLAPAGQAEADTFQSRAITSIDWDGDGRPDLAALSEGPRHPKATDRQQVQAPMGVVIFRNRGDGSWKQLVHFGVEDELFGDSIVVGDFDGDGRDDIATGSNALGRRTIVFLNRGDRAEPVEVEAVRPLAFVWSVATADFDGDGRDDLAVASTAQRVGAWWSAVDVLLSREGEDGALTFERRVLEGGRESADRRFTALGAGDVDGDGAVDLVGVTDTGATHVFLGDRRGGFVREETPFGEPQEGCRGYHVQVADLDGDGRAEPVVAIAGEGCPNGGRREAGKLGRQ